MIPVQVLVAIGSVAWCLGTTGIIGPSCITIPDVPRPSYMTPGTHRRWSGTNYKSIVAVLLFTGVSMYFIGPTHMTGYIGP